MTRILVVNVYSWRNKGDAAIVLGMVEDLRSAFQDAEIVLSTQEPEDDRGRYECEVLGSFRSLALRLTKRRWAIVALMLVLIPASLLWALCRRSLGVRLPLPRAFAALLDAYARADLVVSCGGGYLYGGRGPTSFLGPVFELYALFFASAVGRPLYLYAQSLGPFYGRVQRWMTSLALRGARLFQVREDFSARLARELAGGVTTRVGYDAAFLTPTLFEDGGDIELPELAELPEPVVGLTVRAWSNPTVQARYEKQMVRYIHVLHDRGFSVVIFPQVTVAPFDDDRSVMERFRPYVADLPRVTIIRRELELVEILALMERFTFMVGTRMHSNIMALSRGTPCIAISYQPKTEGIMEQLGMSSYVVPYERATAEALLDRTDGILEHLAELKETLEHQIGPIQQQVYQNGLSIYEDYMSLSSESSRA
ncbi:MAG: polysaccharide pyruvyl transferase family protein [Chloroflexi bacterium]|nr:polysaccharide pyruvyl transferase family protein [Chloroflexota bacterium]